ncbi:MAG: AAA family ATPase [Desulfovibrio sp.]|jgi:putative DNA primase/helicase|nr:AAA family ATPase [Desulfovibrio sp.]
MIMNTLVDHMEECRAASAVNEMYIKELVGHDSLSGPSMGRMRLSAGESVMLQGTDAAIGAAKELGTASACTGHPYLAARGVVPCKGLLVRDMSLLVPILDVGGKCMSVLRIEADGGMYLSNGFREGGHFPIGRMESTGPLLIGVELATCLSLHECSGHPVLVAFKAENLAPVAHMARRRYPERAILLCVDQDTGTDDGQAATYAEKAASAIDAKFLIARDGEGPADFNRLHARYGKGHVARMLDDALGSAPGCGNPPVPSVEREVMAIDYQSFRSMPVQKQEWIINPVLPKPGLIMLHAFRGVGKTNVALTFALAAAYGGSVFGRWRCARPVQTLYIDGEMPERTLKERLFGLEKGMGITVKHDYLRIITSDRLRNGTRKLNLATTEGQDILECNLHGIEFLIIDNLSTLVKGSGIATERALQEWLLQMRNRNISVLLIHHQGKSGEQRGSNSKEDILDTVISLTHPKSYKMSDGAMFKVQLTKARDVFGDDAKPFTVRLSESDNGGIVWMPNDIPADLPQPNQASGNIDLFSIETEEKREYLKNMKKRLFCR